MHRLVAIVAAVGVLSMSASAALLHVHGSAGHEHAEHHHGPAAHSHARAMHHHHEETRGDGTAIEPCDPADEIVPLAFTCVEASQEDAPVPGVSDFRVLAVPTSAPVPVVPSDVRAHSPPRLTDAPLRAPPGSRLA